MKKVFTLFAIATCCFTLAHAQINKGSLFFGGGLGFGTQKDKANNIETSSQKNYSITPAFGYAIQTNLFTGIRLELNNYKTTGVVSISQEQKSNGASVFLRKYKQLRKSDFYLFGEANAGFTANKYTNIYTTSSTQSKGYSIGVSVYPGVAYAVSKRFHLETGFNNLLYLNYSHRTYSQTTSTTESETNGFGIGINGGSSSGIYLGFRFLLAK